MKQRSFESYHQQQWNTLEQWLNDLEKPGHVNDQKITQLPQLYRQVCQHLALARDRHYTPNLIDRLNRLVLRGHQQLYRTQTRFFAKLVYFIMREFPQQVRQDFQLIALSSLFFFGALLIMFMSVQLNPNFVYSFIEVEQVRQLEEMYNPHAEHLGYNRESDSNFMMFGFYIRNNISIGFQTFAGGILLGIGTLFYLIFNGLYLGCVASHLTNLSYIVPFYSFVAGHSSLELIAIVLAGAAGLKLGFALIAPGRQRRSQALRHAAIDSIRLVYGFTGMLLLAAFIEAFWSSNAAIAPQIKYLVGGLLWLSVISYFILVGRHRAT